LEPVGDSISPTSGVKRKERSVDWAEIFTNGPRASLPSTSAIHVLLLVALRIVLGLFTRMRVKGSRALPPGAKLFVPDSQNALGGAFIVSSLRLWASREVYVLVKEGQMVSPFLRFLAERVRIIVPSAELGWQGSLRAACVALRAGRSVVVFPESAPLACSAPSASTVSATSSMLSASVSLQEFQQRYAALAKHAGVPLVPVELQGVGSVLPQDALLPRLGRRVNVTFLPAVMPDVQRNEG
jgi:long-chain acyl-CoA synthetase